jgi:SAM-dependent methyltransferase
MSAVPQGWAPVLARFSQGEISPQIALAQLLLSNSGVDAVAELATLAGADPGDVDLGRLSRLAADHPDQLQRVRAMVASGIDPQNADSAAGRIAATRDLFDRLAIEAPEAAVAIYSLGDPGLLDAATAELVDVIAGWTELRDSTLLDFGCGIGRVGAALAPRVREIVGVDVSAGMIEQARARTDGIPNLRFQVTDGADSRAFGDDVFDLILAIDSFPFLVRAGEDVMRDQLEEFARLLRPGGELLVFNWSYRGDVEADVADAQRLGGDAGFEIRRAGERPFRIWDGVGFHLVRR